MSSRDGGQRRAAAASKQHRRCSRWHVYECRIAGSLPSPFLSDCPLATVSQVANKQRPPSSDAAIPSVKEE